MSENYMLKETLSFPSLFEEIFPALEKETASAIPDSVLTQIDSVYLYGSGDSLNAAVCVAQAFWNFAKLPAYPVPAMLASRYIAPSITAERAARTLTICISTSGEASRSVEASMSLAAAKCRTAAITAVPDSRAARAAEHVITAKIPPFPSAPMPIPGIRSFAPPVIGLMLLAIHTGVLRGVLSAQEAQTLREELRAQKDILQDAFTRCGGTLQAFAKQCGEAQRMEFIATGPCRGAADFGVSKVLEAQGYSVLSQDTEEFAHQTFFSNDTHHLPTVLIMPSQSRSLSRSREILEVLHHLERPVLVLTDDPAALEGSPSTSSVCLSRPVQEEFSALVFACLMTYLASVIPLRDGDTYMHGHSGVYTEDDIPTVRNSGLEVVQ